MFLMIHSVGIWPPPYISIMKHHHIKWPRMTISQPTHCSTLSTWDTVHSQVTKPILTSQSQTVHVRPYVTHSMQHSTISAPVALTLQRPCNEVTGHTPFKGDYFLMIRPHNYPNALGLQPTSETSTPCSLNLYDMITTETPLWVAGMMHYTIQFLHIPESAH